MFFHSCVRLSIVIIIPKTHLTVFYRNDKSVLADEHFAAVEEAREESVLILRWDKYLLIKRWIIWKDI